MTKYVDGFVIVVPKKKVADYKKIAKKCGKVWREHGALEYRESVGEDMNVKWGTPFPKLTKIKKNETIIFAWVVYKSRKHRDQVNKSVMTDPRMNEFCDPTNMPFDIKCMSYGGFNIFVDIK